MRLEGMAASKAGNASIWPKHETVKTLRTGDCREDHVATESPVVLLHRADGSLSGDRGVSDPEALP